ncbi:MAG: ATP-binding protein, partial [Pseudomonadota bacterium]
DLMRTEADRMDHLIRDLLSLSRVEAEQKVRPTDVVDIATVIDTAMRRLTTTAQRAGVDLDAPQLHAPHFVLADADQLIQVVSNLVENAIKYGRSETGGSVQIKVSETDYDSALRGPVVRLDVVDFGDGIEPFHIPRLTERFYRADTHRSRQLGGTGLGLAIVKHIINRHRGRLRIKSERGVGSMFSVFLPRHDATDETHKTGLS